MNFIYWLNRLNIDEVLVTARKKKKKLSTFSNQSMEHFRYGERGEKTVVGTRSDMLFVDFIRNTSLEADVISVKKDDD